MKVAAVALVLVILAAVVLWLGDTLNAWTPGSLLGSQAALLFLLLSIPISLTLFVFLAHHQQEKDAQRRREKDSS